MRFLQPSVTLSLSDPNVLLSTLFSKILNLYSYFTVRDQVNTDTKQNCVPSKRISKY
jgi:hypothetical protein